MSRPTPTEAPSLVCPECHGTGARECLAAHVFGPEPTEHEWRPVVQRCPTCRGTGHQQCEVCGHHVAVGLEEHWETGERVPQCGPCLADGADAEVDASVGALRRLVADVGPGALEAVADVVLQAVLRRVLVAAERQRRFSGRA